ncbi:MAG: hypothetical protein OXO51_09545, partial [Gemmatimonadota bacterium]|nr:hypothetical protein [Gemmatimonadota bacterium]
MPSLMIADRYRLSVLVWGRTTRDIAKAYNGTRKEDTAMPEAQIAVIGGTGFYGMEGLTDLEEVRPDTPFGSPSDAIVTGTLKGRRVAFLARHGRGHRLGPSEINV